MAQLESAKRIETSPLQGGEREAGTGSPAPDYPEEMRRTYEVVIHSRSEEVILGCLPAT